jgi:chitodextrinase
MVINQLRIIVIGMLLLGLPPANASPVYPVKTSSSNPRILVDQNNVPFLMVGDSPQSLMVNLSAANAASYLADRATNGFNTVLVDAICTTYTFGPANASLLNGTLPFTNTIPGTGSYDLTTPNEAYFAFVDQIVNLAATNGIEVMLDPIETGGWLTTMLNNGTGNCRAYGQYLGNRYKNFPNIIWCSGNDFQNWNTPANDAVVLAVALGIKDKDTNHLQTTELGYYLSSSLDDSNWVPIVGLNSAYTYAPTYAEVLHAYNQSSAIPTFMIEANYEYEANSGTDGGSTRNLRMQEYWTMLSGASGQLYGSLYTVRFTSGWQSHLDSPGVVQLDYMANLFGSRAWYNLVPDQTHAFVTGGYGSFANGIPGAGSGEGVNSLFTGNNYVTTALTPDGSLGMAYLPQGGTITVAMTKLQNTVTARWFDPSANTFTAIAGSPFSNTGTQNFTPPGNNSAGNTDWVLVLETVANPLQIATGSLPSATMGVTYSCQIQAIGGSPPYSWSLTSSSPPIPPDLSFSANGLLSGLPTITGVFTLMVQVLDSTNAWATKNFAILITAPDTTPPTAPTNLVASAVSSSQINLSWTVSTDNVGVTGYLVQRSLGAGSTNFAQIATPTGTNYSDSGLAANSTYSYRVQAMDAAGNLSGYSGVASVTTLSAPSGLVAAYGFNEGAGTTVTDASGNGNNGTISGATWTTSGRYGNALVFNGTSALVTINNATTLQLSTAMTLEAWVNPSTVSSAWRDVIFKANDNYFLEGTSTTSSRPAIGGTFASSSLYGTTALAVNTWTHLAATYDGTTMRLYVNGTQVSSQAQTGAIASSTNPLQIGGDSLYGQFFQGTIDEVRIYNVALTAAQIQTDMNAPISATPDTQPPTAPTNLMASAVSSSQINLNWAASTDNVGVTGYLVQRSPGAGSTNFIQIATPTGTNYSDTSLTAATTYNYRVQAVDAAGNLSGYSGVASVTTLVSDTTPPTAPTNLVASAVSSSQINLSWTVSTDNVGVTGYLVQRSLGAGSTNFAQVGTSSGTTFSNTGLSSRTRYNYRVQATDAAGNLSGYSSVASATTR